MNQSNLDHERGERLELLGKRVERVLIHKLNLDNERGERLELFSKRNRTRRAAADTRPRATAPWCAITWLVHVAGAEEARE